MDTSGKGIAGIASSSKAMTWFLSLFLQKECHEPCSGTSRAQPRCVTSGTLTAFLGCHSTRNGSTIRSPLTPPCSHCLSLTSCSLRQKNEAKRTSGNLVLGGRRRTFSTLQSSVPTEVLSSRVSWSTNGLNKAATAKEVKEGWPSIKSPEQTYEGPLSKHCGCGHTHQSLSLSKAKETNISPSVCAHFLQSLPRLPEERGQLITVNFPQWCTFLLSPFRLRQSRSLLAAAATNFAGPLEGLAGVTTSARQCICCEREVRNEGEKRRKRQGEEEGTGRLQFQHVVGQARSLAELEGGAKRARVVDEASTERLTSEDDRGNGCSEKVKKRWIQVDGRESNCSADRPIVVTSRQFQHSPKTAHSRQPEKCGSARALEPVLAESSSSGSCEDGSTLQPSIKRWSELQRSKPTRRNISEVERLQKRHLYIGRGASHLGCKRSFWANPFEVKRFGRLGAISKFEALFNSSPVMQSRLGQLTDKVLLCHCFQSESCHGARPDTRLGRQVSEQRGARRRRRSSTGRRALQSSRTETPIRRTRITI